MSLANSCGKDTPSDLPTDPVPRLALQDCHVLGCCSLASLIIASSFSFGPKVPRVRPRLQGWWREREHSNPSWQAAGVGIVAEDALRLNVGCANGCGGKAEGACDGNMAKHKAKPCAKLHEEGSRAASEYPHPESEFEDGCRIERFEHSQGKRVRCLNQACNLVFDDA
jgi:hypothetical protein